jgi:hypothetical protein
LALQGGSAHDHEADPAGKKANGDGQAACLGD